MKRLIYCCLILLTSQCRERFDVPLDQPAQGYLVVEGFINPAGITSIRLSATNKLSERNILPVQGAVLQIVGEDNTAYALNEQGSGVYASENLILNAAVKYRLNIKTQEAKEYVSTFTSAKNTPDIDTLSYIYDENGVEIYVQSHDPQNNTHYYQWDYEETWEFNSAFRANLTFNVVQGPDPVPIASLAFFYETQTNNDSIYTCWKDDVSSSILIGSTVKLAQDIIYTPIVAYKKGSWPLSKLYSINVKQHAISREQYDFLAKMKKNSENLGTLFDAQPSDITGNITCITNPGELVIGNIEVSTEKQKRIFISNTELPGWNYDQQCEQRQVANNPDSIQQAYDSHVLPTTPAKTTLAGTIIYFWVSPELCVDCTLRGTNNKPSFWP